MANEAFTLDRAKKIKKVLGKISSLNALIYRLSKGRIWGNWAGKHAIMILTTVGRKTEKTRHIPLIKVTHNDQPLLVASMGGMPMHPTWYYNVLSNPRVVVQIGSEKKYYLAKKLSDDEKKELWPTVISFYPDYDAYQKRTQRNIGVFICEEKKMTQEWKDWLTHNIERGCDKNELYSILFNDGFHPELIASEMGVPMKSLSLTATIKVSDKEQTIQKMVTAFKNAHKTIPIYTKDGFYKDKLDHNLHKKVLDFHNANSGSLQVENVAGGYIKTEGKGSASHTIELPNDLRDEIHESLLNKAEKWSGIKLLPTYVYGVRIYNRGAILSVHRDREETHIIGVIINIDQDVETDWPLEIEDHSKKKHEVILEPGEIIFYESANLDHGRPNPLEGNKFVNVFCHYMPYIEGA